MDESNRILVNEGPVTIMINSQYPKPKNVDLVLRGLCHTIAGVDASQDWFRFAELMRDTTIELRNRLTQSSTGSVNK